MIAYRLEVRSNRFPAIAAGMMPKAEAAVQKTVKDGESHSKRIVPVDTGRLKNSIGSGMQGKLRGEWWANTEYDIYVEFGTYKMAKQPYMVPAAEAMRGPFFAAMAAIFS